MEEQKRAAPEGSNKMEGYGRFTLLPTVFGSITTVPQLLNDQNFLVSIDEGFADSKRVGARDSSSPVVLGRRTSSHNSTTRHPVVSSPQPQLPYRPLETPRLQFVGSKQLDYWLCNENQAWPISLPTTPCCSKEMVELSPMNTIHKGVFDSMHQAQRPYYVFLQSAEMEKRRLMDQRNCKEEEDDEKIDLTLKL